MSSENVVEESAKDPKPGETPNPPCLNNNEDLDKHIEKMTDPERERCELLDKTCLEKPCKKNIKESLLKAKLVDSICEDINKISLLNGPSGLTSPKFWIDLVDELDSKYTYKFKSIKSVFSWQHMAEHFLNYTSQFKPPTMTDKSYKNLYSQIRKTMSICKIKRFTNFINYVITLDSSDESNGRVPLRVAKKKQRKRSGKQLSKKPKKPMIPKKPSPEEESDKDVLAGAKKLQIFDKDQDGAPKTKQIEKPEQVVEEFQKDSKKLSGTKRPQDFDEKGFEKKPRIELDHSELEERDLFAAVYEEMQKTNDLSSRSGLISHKFWMKITDQLDSKYVHKGADVKNVRDWKELATLFFGYHTLREPFEMDHELYQKFIMAISKIIVAKKFDGYQELINFVTTIRKRGPQPKQPKQ